MIIYRITETHLCENTYILVKDGYALIIDPGVSADLILRECAKLGAEPLAVLLTHGHYDHILGASVLSERGLKIYAHEQETEVLRGRANLALLFGGSIKEFPIERGLKEDEVLLIPPFSVKVLYTPGHTQGSVCYYIEGAVFTGDTLFAGSYGRTDFPTGDEQDLLVSITDVLFDLSPETPVYAGHAGAYPPDLAVKAVEASPDTTIGKEYSTNPILDLL